MYCYCFEGLTTDVLLLFRRFEHLSIVTGLKV